MANIHDIISLVSAAEGMEKTDVDGAFYRLEMAERTLERHILAFGLSLDDLEGPGCPDAAGVYRPILDRIRNGYRRLETLKGR